MSDTYTRLRATALKLVKDFGRTIQISESTLALADPAKPWGSVSDVTSTSTYSTYGAFVQEDAGADDSNIESANFQQCLGWYCLLWSQTTLRSLSLLRALAWFQRQRCN